MKIKDVIYHTSAVIPLGTIIFEYTLDFSWNSSEKHSNPIQARHGGLPVWRTSMMTVTSNRIPVIKIPLSFFCNY